MVYVCSLFNRNFNIFSPHKQWSTCCCYCSICCEHPRCDRLCLFWGVWVTYTYQFVFHESLSPASTYQSAFGAGTLYWRLSVSLRRLQALLIGSTLIIASLTRHLCNLNPRDLNAPIMQRSPISGET